MPATMDTPETKTPNPAAGENTGTITSLITGILDDGKTLARQQMEMFKSEVREDFKKSVQAAQYGGMGMACLIVGALGLVTAVAYLLHEQFHLSMWVSWGIISLVFLGIGAALALASDRILKSFNPLPDKALTAVKENLTWNKK
ncbi:phage holin family protein [Limnoglobus roseus]|uniref:Phage holin family protein n=1 Tax=Limnoglobus roseus TaxID=2598579 RepID=A0A5C1A4N4_9BACT|nr:phage holin family protein [Limnoglobus roseus]QEL13630.1 phage holin family protein [Limnoglobus roseus]